MKRRRLKVSRTHVESRARAARVALPPIPQLRIQGRWLDKAGFTIGCNVRVAVARGLLALEVIEPTNENDPN